MLPKIQTPVFKLALPSTGKEITYRSFLVKEEKILLIAKESGETKEMVEALKQIVNNCVIGDINVNKMPLFDLEYVFLMIRSKSQSNVVQIKYVDPEDKKEYDAFFDYDKIKIEHSEDHNAIIDLDGTVGVTMRYPTIDDLDKLSMFSKEGGLSGTQAMDLIRTCIKSVFTSEDDYPMENASVAERDEFFDSLTPDYMVKIQKFFDTFPTIVGYIEYRKDKEKQVKEVKGIANFL